MLSKLLPAALFVIVVGGIAGAAFYFGRMSKSSPVDTTVNTVSSTPAAKQVSPAQATPTPSPTDTTQSIKTSIPAKKYADLSSVLADSVSITLYATECCGPKTKAETITQLAYLNGATNWSFDQASPIAVKLIAADPTNFKNTVIGTSSNNYAVAFHLNAAAMIDKIFIVADYHLIAP